VGWLAAILYYLCLAWGGPLMPPCCAVPWPQVSDSGVRALARCSQLRSLNAGVLHRLTDSAVADVCSQASLLTSLVLNQSLVSDAALGAIGRCGALEELALHGCASVSNLVSTPLPSP